MLSNYKKTTGFLLVTAILFCVEIAQAQNINNPNKMGPLGTQVNTLSGNLFIPRSDVFLTGRGLDIDLSFYYNAFFYDKSFGFGKGWTSMYSIFYKLDTANGETIFWGDGREDSYKANGAAYTPPKGIFSALTQYQPNKFLITKLDGLKYFFDNAVHKKITRIEEPNGNFLNFTYSDTLLTSITNTAGQTITLAYNAQGNLASITDAVTGPTRTYTYIYDGTQNLKQVNDPLGNNCKYTYLVNGPMKTISDKNSNTVDVIYYGDYSVSEIIGCNKRISLSYDTSLKVTTLTEYVDGGNQVTKYGYKSFENLSWLSSLVSNCCGYKMNFEFDTKGNKTKQTDANGNISTYTYDVNGNMLTMTDALNQTMTYTYSTDYNRITSFIDPKGFNTTMTYDLRGNLMQLLAPGNLLYRSSYSPNGDIVSSVDPKGNIYLYNYDTYGNPTDVTGPNGYHATLGFDARGNLLSSIDARGNTSSMEYDILDRLKKAVDPINNNIQMSYDPQGNVTNIINQNGETSNLKYDASNRVVEFKDAIGNKNTFGYDAMDNIINVKDALNHATSFGYDTRNRLNIVKDALGNTNQLSYDVKGNILQMNLPNGQILNYTYDALDRVKTISDITGSIAAFSYDKNNNITSYTNATGAIFTAFYDSLNRTKQMTDPLGNSMAISYDKNNNVSIVTDRNGNTKTYIYDSLNRVKTYTDNNGYVTSVSYDAQSNVVALRDQNNNTTTYTYDSLNRVKRTTYPDLKYIEFAFDKKGNVVSRRLTDATIINYLYDSINRLISKTLPDGQVYAYTYDALGRIKSATNNTGTVTLAYDELNRLIAETFDGRTNTYNYNIAGRTQSTIYPDSTFITKTFDIRNNLLSIAKNNSVLVTYQYNNANQVIAKSFANGISTNMHYDVANRLSNFITGSGVIQNSSFTYDKEQNKTAINRINAPVKSEQYSFDNDYRVTSFKKGIIGSAPISQNNYTYDALGNRTAANLNGTNTTYTTNNLNQLTNSNNGLQNINFTYDDNGNLTYDGTYFKKYDAEERLIKDSSSPSSVILYQYDALGRRTTKIINGAPLKYTYSGLAQIEERDGVTNAIRTKTIFDNFLMPVNNEKNGNNFYYHQNELNSVEAITNDQGKLIEKYEYDVYGQLSRYDSLGNPMASSITGNRFAYTGQEYDSATNSYRFFFRNYSPATGTFNQRDLIGYADGTGMYQYVHNNPANGVDVFGLADDPCKGKKPVDPNGGNHPWWDFGTATGIFGEVVNDISTSQGVVGITQLTLFRSNNLSLFNNNFVLNNSKFLNTGFSKLGFLATATSAVDYGKNLYDNGLGVMTLGEHLDGLSGIGLNALSSTKSPYAPVAAAGNLLQSEIKYITKGEYGGYFSFMQSMYSQKFNDIAGNSKYLDQELEYKVLKRFQQMDVDEETLSEYKKHHWLRNYFNSRDKRDNQKRANPPKSDCPQNADPAGTRRPVPYPPGFVGPKKPVEIIGPKDPNTIIGPDGQPGKKWVSVKDALPYTILYENSKSASAPAKFVRVTYPINVKQEKGTFYLSNYGFNNLLFTIPANTSSYSTRLDVRDSLGLFVDVTAGLDVTNNTAFWEFQSIDPLTLLPPTDPLKGFLLLQDSVQQLKGHGFVNFTIKPKSTDITLDTIHAEASIVFDRNDTIPTNFVTNTVDAFAPTSHMNTLSATSPNPVQLSWTGTDDINGCGVKSYTLYVSTDGVNFNIVRTGITRTDTSLVLSQDSSYCFFVLATDSVGNMETLRQNEIKCAIVSGAPLPISWLYFRGSNKGKDNFLEWATANEQNNKVFELQRSLNGVNFTGIASIASQGNSITQQNYNYKDVGIDKLNSPVMYYRIKQIDLNASFKYSNIVRLNYNIKEKMNSIVYPNPTQGMITVTVGENSLIGTIAVVMDVNGRVLQQIKIAAQSQSINLNNFSNGTYFIRLQNKEVLRIVKQ